MFIRSLNRETTKMNKQQNKIDALVLRLEATTAAFVPWYNNVRLVSTEEFV